MLRVTLLSLKMIPTHLDVNVNVTQPVLFLDGWSFYQENLDHTKLFWIYVYEFNSAETKHIMPHSSQHH